MTQQAIESVTGQRSSDEDLWQRFAEHGTVLEERRRNGSPPTQLARERRVADPKNLFTDVVVYVDGRADNQGTLEVAASLARDQGARLTGVFIEPEAPVRHAEMFARGKGIPELLEACHSRLRTMEADRRDSFEATVRRHRLRGEWRLVPCVNDGDLAAHARYGDLAVVARPDPVDEPASDDLLESLVLTSGRPTLVLPPHCPAGTIRRILVGWNASREATRAVADAMPLIVRADVVEVLVVDREGPLGQHGPEPGADIARYLARHGARVEVRQVWHGSEDVGRLLLSRAAAFGADLLVMGAYGHSHLREWLLGGVTRTILREARIPVLMSR
jgi:nucleotide-binding universal stress UspA family protein